MLSAGAAFIIRDLLESGGPLGRAVESGAGIRRGIAWKTGTSFGFRDAWSVGVSDRYTIGVWVGRPDGTPNPGFFGANIAAPLLVDLFNALDAGPPAPRTPPPGVKQERICWPLGTRAAGLDDRLCHQSRLAWTLNDAAPPTFPDRLRGGEARYEIQTTADGQLRARPDCHPGPLDTRPMARWPAVLEPWLDDNLRRRALPPQWAASCAGQARPESGLKIVGASNGEILRRSAGGDAPLLHLQVRGHSVHGKAGGPGTEVVWLVNGRPSARQPAGKGFEQRLTEPGRYDITVLDDSGAYDRISLSVR